MSLVAKKWGIVGRGLRSSTSGVVACMLFLALLGNTVPAVAEGAGPPAIEMSRYVVALVYTGPEWRPAEIEGVKELEEAHLANIFRLRSTGDMLISGPFASPEEGGPVGLFVFAVATVAEAEALLETDPAIRSGHFRAELLPWLTPSPLGAGEAVSKAAEKIPAASDAALAER